MAMLPFKSSRNELCAVIHVLWAKRLNANKIHSETTRPAIYIWCTKFARHGESIIDKKQPSRNVVATTDAKTVTVDDFVRSVCRMSI